MQPAGSVVEEVLLHPLQQDRLLAGEVPHALRVAGDLRVVDRDRQFPGQPPGDVGAVDAAPAGGAAGD